MNANRVTLDVIDVNTPCPASWDAMSGDGQSRLCEQCGLHVHNLAAMTLDEAQRLVCERAGRLCVRFERDAAGRVLTLDYQRPARTPRTWKFWTFIGAAGAIAKICTPGGSQNECPRYSSNNQVIGLCMQQMWDEGPPPTDDCTGECYETHGHFINMTDTSVKQVACGFHTTASGKVWAVQNFSR